MNAYLNQQREIKHQEEVIDKLKQFNREKSIRRAESREKMLDKIERLEKPVEVRADMNLKLTPHKTSGNDVMQIEGLAKSFGSTHLFDNVSFEIKRGEHVAIIGDNGTGKTTLLKIINELLPPDKGYIKLGTNVEIGYYDQEQQVLHMDKTLFEEISDTYPYLTNTEIRNTLAAFLFTGEDVFKKISALSGGERGRVSLAKLMLSEANFLILDEPTNHLDITSKEILETALNAYEGTILYVSHDRYFINKTASRILELTHHKFINYIGNYDYYLEKKDILTPASDTSAKPSAKEPSEQKLEWKKQKENQANARKKENDLKKCEERIELLEQKSTALEEEMVKPENATNVEKLQKLVQDKEQVDAELEELYEKWVKLSENE